VRGGRGIHGVDPVDERLPAPQDQRRAIEHLRCTEIIARRSKSVCSCRIDVVLVDQAAQDVATEDPELAELTLDPDGFPPGFSLTSRTMRARTSGSIFGQPGGRRG
jgi:hypothetical protein